MALGVLRRSAAPRDRLTLGRSLSVDLFKRSTLRRGRMGGCVGAAVGDPRQAQDKNNEQGNGKPKGAHDGAVLRHARAGWAGS
jgi:hypothetical protein